MTRVETLFRHRQTEAGEICWSQCRSKLLLLCDVAQPHFVIASDETRESQKRKATVFESGCSLAIEKKHVDLIATQGVHFD
jgi:hypothetical protein